MFCFFFFKKEKLSKISITLPSKKKKKDNTLEKRRSTLYCSVFLIFQITR